MKRLLSLLVVSALLLVAGAAGALAGAPIGEVTNATDTVRANGSSGARVLTNNADIFFMDRISTNATGTGEFQFSDGTKLAIGPSASLAVDSFVFKDKSSFEKLGLSAAKGTFRWISGRSPPSAYQIRTPLGTMGIRGTAFDVTIRNGRVYVALITGSAKFCSGSSCRTLSRSCDFIVADGGSLSKPMPVSSAFKSRESAAKIFPFLARPGQLSSRFRVGGGNCLGRVTFNDPVVKPESAAEPPVTEPPPEPPPKPEPPPAPEPDKQCDGNCGKGKGKGGGNGTGNEGKGKGHGGK